MILNRRSLSEDMLGPGNGDVGVSLEGWFSNVHVILALLSVFSERTLAFEVLLGVDASALIACA